MRRAESLQRAGPKVCSCADSLRRVCRALAMGAGPKAAG